MLVIIYPETGMIKWVWAGAGLALISGIILVGYKEIKSSRWDGQTRYVLLETVTNNLIIRSIDPKVTGSAVQITLPANIMVNTTQDRGRWSLESLVKLGNKYGARWVTDSVINGLELPLTVWDRDMGWWDRVRWLILSWGVRWKTVEVENTPILMVLENPDGQKEYQITDKWSEMVKQNLNSWVMQQQTINVSVFNTTNTTGLGTRYARILEHLGLKVQMVGDRPQISQKCLIKTNQKIKRDLVILWIIKNLGCVWTEKADLPDNEAEIEVGLYN